MIQYMRLDPGSDPVLVKTPGGLTYDQLVGIVGYPLQVLNLRAGKATMYLCEEGKLQGLAYNTSATALAKGSIADDDMVVGTAVILGPLGPGGVDTTLPDETADTLMEALR